MNHTAVQPGQKYQDVKEKTGRTLTVLSVALQEHNEGRFKARYTYATCDTGCVKVKIDTDRLLSSAYRLVAAEAVVPAQSRCGVLHLDGEGNPSACPSTAVAD